MPARTRWAQRLGVLLGLVGIDCGGAPRDGRVLEWARSRPLAAGVTDALALPEDLAAASADAQVHVARLADRRTCILLKKTIGWKGNFEGVLQCDAALLPDEIVTAPARAYVTLPGHGVFEELYVRRRRDDRTFDVYFDLN